MSFGYVMRTKTNTGLRIELAPFTKEDTKNFVPGLERASTSRFLGLMPQTEEQEVEWYDKISRGEDSLAWGVWVIEDDAPRKLIGATTISGIGPHVSTQRNMIQGTTGISLSDQTYWGRGIATAAHAARTWYAFRQHGIVRLKSAVAQTNHASRRALERVGYVLVFTERNYQFIDGKQVHEDNFECLNPDDWAWRLWWGDDRPTVKATDARKVTRAALDWAEKNVELL